jgi:hypothetical protein
MSPLTGVLTEAWDLYRRFARHFLLISFVIYVITAVLVARHHRQAPPDAGSVAVPAGTDSGTRTEAGGTARVVEAAWASSGWAWSGPDG